MNKGLIIAFVILCFLNIMSFTSIYCIDLYDENKLKKFNVLSILTIIFAGISWFILLAVLTLLQLSPIKVLAMECIYIIPQLIYYFVKNKGQEDLIMNFLKEKVVVVMGLITPIIIISMPVKPLIDTLL